MENIENVVSESAKGQLSEEDWKQHIGYAKNFLGSD